MHVINKNLDGMIGLSDSFPESQRPAVLAGRHALGLGAMNASPLKWMSTDRRESGHIRHNHTLLSYEDRVKERGEDWYYHPSKIENQPLYQYNDYGHRSQYNLKDLSTRKRIDGYGFGIAFGCSYTEGIGLATKDIYHQVLGEMMRMPVYNCGLGACGNDVSFWNFSQAMRRYKPNFVVFQLSGSGRTMLTNWDSKPPGIDLLNMRLATRATGQINSDTSSKELDLLLIMNELRLDTWRTIQIIEAVKTICDISSTPLVFWDGFQEFRTDRSFSQVIVEGIPQQNSAMQPVSADIHELMVIAPAIDKARDDAHPGPKSNQVIAERIYEKLKK